MESLLREFGFVELKPLGEECDFRVFEKDMVIKITAFPNKIEVGLTESLIESLSSIKFRWEKGLSAYDLVKEMCPYIDTTITLSGSKNDLEILRASIIKMVDEFSPFCWMDTVFRLQEEKKKEKIRAIAKRVSDSIYSELNGCYSKQDVEFICNRIEMELW